MRRWLVFAGTLSLGVLSTLIVQRVRAAGAPKVGALTYSGYLELPDGTPVDAEKPIGVAVYDAATKGKKVAGCEVPSDPPTRVTRGRFQLALPDACAAAIQARPDLWIEVQVEGLSLGLTKLGSVPYALEADHAVSADAAQSAAGTLATQLATLRAEVDVLKTHDVFIFEKKGNNGTVSCKAYCEGATWLDRGPNANGAGTCVGAYRADQLKYIPCDVSPAASIPGGLDCWCSRAAP
ncbi:MAG: hypothetical protein ACOY0T_14645 [Myxococcota bacterium]